VEQVQALPAASGAKGETRVEEPTRAERTIARRAAEVRATVPDLELGAEIDMTACVALAAVRACSTTAIVTRACALALREVPRANGAYRDGRFELYSRVNIGVVMEVDDGFVVPTVLDADGKTLEQLSDELELLSDRARSGLLTPPELANATFTMTDLGTYGVDRPGTIITGGQAAALAAGAVREVPVVRDAAIVSGHVMSVTLVSDHRIISGARAATFLARIRSFLEAAAL
jgi:pyruvate dehydrogenase E2 component (dihydrolipoamide acetyltransferase)